MKIITLLLSASLLCAGAVAADENFDALKRELQELKKRVAALEADKSELKKQLTVDRLIVRKELIVSDTGEPWEKGFEKQMIPRGIYARPVGDGVGGLWVRSRLIKGEIDDPFDDRFHALERDGSLRRAPGHISWNVWIDGAWRQMAIIQGEGLEPSEMPPKEWTGGNHPGRLRFQTYRPGHNEPLTDALIGQGMTSAQIAKKLCRTIKTIEWHRSAIARKLNTKDRVALAQLAVQAGLCSPTFKVPSGKGSRNGQKRG